MSIVALFEAYQEVNRAKQREAEKDAKITELESSISLLKAAAVNAAYVERTLRADVAIQQERTRSAESRANELGKSCVDWEKYYGDLQDRMATTASALWLTREDLQRHQQALLDAAAVATPKTLYVEVSSTKQQETIDQLRETLSQVTRSLQERIGQLRAQTDRANSLRNELTAARQRSSAGSTNYDARKAEMRGVVNKLMSLVDKPLGGSLDDAK